MALMFLLGNTCGVLMVVSRSVEHRIIAELKRRKAETLAGEKKNCGNLEGDQIVLRRINSLIMRFLKGIFLRN